MYDNNIELDKEILGTILNNVKTHFIDKNKEYLYNINYNKIESYIIKSHNNPIEFYYYEKVLLYDINDFCDKVLDYVSSPLDKIIK